MPVVPLEPIALVLATVPAPGSNPWTPLGVLALIWLFCAAASN